MAVKRSFERWQSVYTGLNLVTDGGSEPINRGGGQGPGSLLAAAICPAGLTLGRLANRANTGTLSQRHVPLMLLVF